MKFFKIVCLIFLGLLLFAVQNRFKISDFIWLLYIPIYFLIISPLFEYWNNRLKSKYNE